jgi:gallate dioxygenase
MASIVGAFGVPHMPTSPGDCAANPDSLTARAFAAVRRHVDEIDPDVLLVFDTDHFHQWFYDRLPAFAVGVADRTDGPGTDDWPGEARFDHIPVDEALASHVYASGISAAFDLTLSEEFQVDHSITVPVHFLDTRSGVVERPIVPVWINGIAPPFPLASRCRDLGAMVSAAIAAYPANTRVGLVASGAISGDIGGAHARPGSPMAPPDEAWLADVEGWVREEQLDALVAAATPDRLRAAGNVSGECLNWIALLGAISGPPPTFLHMDTFGGNAFAAWDLR